MHNSRASVKLDALRAPPKLENLLSSSHTLFVSMQSPIQLLDNKSHIIESKYRLWSNKLEYLI